MSELHVPTLGPELAKALVAAQKAAKAVAKDAENTFHRYKYASAEALVEEARGALASAGLAVMPLSVDRDSAQLDHVWEGEGNDAFIITPRRIRSTYLLLHESGQSQVFWFTTPVIPEKGRPEDKAEFGSRTENLGYAMRDLLLLPRGTDGAGDVSGRDDTDKKPRGPARRDARDAPKASAPAGQSATSGVSAPSTTDQPAERAAKDDDRTQRVKNLARLLTTAAPDGCGWSRPECEAWAQKRLGKTKPSDFTDQEIKDTTLVALAFMAGGQIDQLAKEAELIAAGRMRGDVQEQAA